MEKLMSIVQGVVMLGLLAVVVVGYWAIGTAAVQAQTPCGADPYCHEGTRGSPLYAVVAACDAPNCNSKIQWCCIEFP